MARLVLRYTSGKVNCRGVHIHGVGLVRRGREKEDHTRWQWGPDRLENLKKTNIAKKKEGKKEEESKKRLAKFYNRGKAPHERKTTPTRRSYYSLTWGRKGKG